MNVCERQARALESIAHELKSIGQSLKRIEEKTIPPFRDRDPLAEAKKRLGTVESPGMCNTTIHHEEQFRAFCGCNGLPCIECTPGACDHRRFEGGGNG